MSVKQIFNVLSIFLSSILFFFPITSLAAEQITQVTQVKQTPVAVAPFSLPTTVSEQELFSFGESVVLNVFNYDHTNYENKTASWAKYFTPQAWEKFTKALADSKNLEAVSQYKMSVTAKLHGASRIVSSGKKDKRDYWEIIVPVIVTYSDQNDKGLMQDLIIKLDIARQNKITANGTSLLVEQFVAEPKLPGGTR